jgi:hypothetical protein
MRAVHRAALVRRRARGHLRPLIPQSDGHPAHALLELCMMLIAHALLELHMLLDLLGVLAHALLELHELLQLHELLELLVHLALLLLALPRRVVHNRATLVRQPARGFLRTLIAHKAQQPLAMTLKPQLLLPRVELGPFIELLFAHAVLLAPAMHVCNSLV